MASPIDRHRFVFLFLLAALCVSPVETRLLGQSSDTHIHDGESHVVSANLSLQMRVRVEYLQSRIMCDCAKENYSRTLKNCPDGCATPQKRIIEQMVRDGSPDQEVYEAMLSNVGGDRRVLATPGSGFGLWAYALPFVVLIVGAFLAITVIGRWSKIGSEARVERQRSIALLSGEELERVERELAELD